MVSEECLKASTELGRNLNEGQLGVHLPNN